MANKRYRIRDFDQKPLHNWDDVQPGMAVYLKYYGLWHAVLVTETEPENDYMYGIHYGCKNIFATREVMEEAFEVKLDKLELYKIDIPVRVRVSNSEAIERGRKRIGEKSFNIFTRRSSHLVLQCILKGF